MLMANFGKEVKFTPLLPYLADHLLQIKKLGCAHLIALHPVLKPTSKRNVESNYLALSASVVEYVLCFTNQWISQV